MTGPSGPLTSEPGNLSINSGRRPTEDAPLVWILSLACRRVAPSQVSFTGIK